MDHLRQMTNMEFIRRLKVDCDAADRSYALFLGAGCSVSSGIPASASLVKDQWLPRLRDLCAPESKNINDWIKTKLPGYDSTNPAESYGKLMDLLFRSPQDQQREVERLCDGKFPNYGYAILALLNQIKPGKFNALITTNFDDLIADAFYLFTSTRPLVIAHEALAGFIRPSRTRPFIIKLHGDYHLSPLNTEEEIKTISPEISDQMESILYDKGLIFLGYGGNDQGIADMFAKLPAQALLQGIYWVSKNEPENALRSWLEVRNAFWVPFFDFDEMMFHFQDVFQLASPSDIHIKEALDKIAQIYLEFTQKYRDSTKPIDKEMKEAVKRTDEKFQDWLAVYIQASKIEKDQPEKANEIYLTGLKQHPNSKELLNNYALFLQTIRKDHDQAEEKYKKALEVDPNDATVLGDYASFLTDIRKDHDQAEEKYKKALEIEPNSPNKLGNYSKLLFTLGKEKLANELLYKALSMKNLDEYQGLQSELWFYAFANGPVEKRANALKNLKTVILAGDRSIYWNLSENVKKAEMDGHPDVKWLYKLADVITKDADIHILDEWEKWKKA